MQLSAFCVLECSRRERMLKRLSPLLLIKPTSTENSACGNGGDEFKISEFTEKFNEISERICYLKACCG